MLSRSCNRIHCLSKCLGPAFSQSTKLCSSKLYLSSAATQRFSSTQEKERPADFTNVINTLVEKEKRFSYAYANNLKNVTSIIDFKEFCENSRPANPQEVLLTLQRLVNLCNNENRDDIINFLKSESYVSCLSAHLSTNDVDINCLLEVTSCILHILTELPSTKEPKDVEETLSLIPDFNAFFNNLVKLLSNKITSTNAEEIDVNIVARLFGLLLRHNYGGVDNSFMEDYKKLLMRKIPEIELTATVISLLKSLNDDAYSEKMFMSLIYKKIEELSSDMLLGELITVFSSLAEKQERHIPTLQNVAEAINRHRDIMNANQLSRLAVAANKFNFFNPRLIRRFYTDVINSVNSFQEWSQITNVVTFLSRAGVTNDKVWEVLADWMNKNYRAANKSALAWCITSLAVVNVKPELIEPIGTFLASELKPSSNEKPRAWLNSIWALTVLKYLTPHLAESVLRKEFEEELFATTSSKSSTTFIAQRLCQIRAATKFDLDNYQGASDILTGFDFDVETCKSLKYGVKSDSGKATRFQDYLTMPIQPPFRIGPKFYPEYGVFINSLVCYDTKKKSFVQPTLASKNDNRPLDGLIAVLYFTSKHYTSVYGGEDVDNRRLLGDFALGVRHLKAAGAKVLIIAEHDLEQLIDRLSKIAYIKEKIVETAMAE